MTDGTTEAQTPEGTTEAKDSQVQEKDWESEYRKLQADYTKKSQKLAELEKSQQSSDVNDDEKQLYEWNKSKGFVTKDELESVRNEALQAKQALQEQEFKDLLRQAPDLKKFESAIRAIQKSEGGSFDEIVIKHGFLSTDKLEKAKNVNDRMIGDSYKESKREKSVSEMTSEEYAARKKQNGITGNSSFVSHSA